MKLHLKKNQASKLFGGVKFELEAKVVLTAEESALINKYKVQDEVLVEKTIKIPFTDRGIVIKMTIGSLVSGQTFKCNDIAEIIGYVDTIKGSCENFRNFLEVMKSFGGEEIIDYNAEGAKMVATAG